MTTRPCFLRVASVAQQLNVSVRTVRRWIADGTVPSVKIGGARMVPIEALAQLTGGSNDGLFDDDDDDQKQHALQRTIVFSGILTSNKCSIYDVVGFTNGTTCHPCHSLGPNGAEAMTSAAKSLEDIISHIGRSDLSPLTKRDMTSAITRMAAMGGASPAAIGTTPSTLRELLSRIQPAAHGISPKTWANVRSLFEKALVHAGVVDDRGRGKWTRHGEWRPVMQFVSGNKRLVNGLSSFANWCAMNRVMPAAVSNEHVQQFREWLEARTLFPEPKARARDVPLLWNKAAESIEGWPRQRLTRISFKRPNERMSWKELPESFYQESRTYLNMRAAPDPFDERPNTPSKALAQKTIRLQSEHLRLAASSVAESGLTAPNTLAELVAPENVKAALRFYHDKAGRKPNAFATGLAATLLQVARYAVDLPQNELGHLKLIVSKLPTLPPDLTEKNKKLLRELESDRVKARLLHLPATLLAETRKSLTKGRLRHADAAAGVAIAILLCAPLRPQNLATLNWRRHFSEPNGVTGQIILYIPKEETKTKKRDLVFELPSDVGKLIRWYRREMHSRVGADPDGSLFVNGDGKPKSQQTLTLQIEEMIRRHLGLKMTPHQFRHLAAHWFLEVHPEAFAVVQDLLGHGWSKTTRVYAGSSTRRAGRAYASLVIERAKSSLQLTGRKPKRRKSA
jgi:excisionase family DNA binding protein